MKNLNFYIASLFLITIFGCTTTTHKFTLISTKPSQLTLNQDKTVIGESCRKNILFLIPINSDSGLRSSQLEDAIDNALSKEKGSTALANVKVKGKYLLTFIYNDFCTIVEGNPVITKP